MTISLAYGSRFRMVGRPDFMVESVSYHHRTDSMLDADHDTIWVRSVKTGRKTNWKVSVFCSVFECV